MEIQKLQTITTTIDAEPVHEVWVYTKHEFGCNFETCDSNTLEGLLEKYNQLGRRPSYIKPYTPADLDNRDRFKLSKFRKIRSPQDFVKDVYTLWDGSGDRFIHFYFFREMDYKKAIYRHEYK